MMDNEKEERDEILKKLGEFRKEGREDEKDGEPIEEIRPEDTIPDLPENQAAREFLRNAPSKGLWLPMGVEVKVMQCWRCKAYGHRTNDRECPLYQNGNVIIDSERQAREDPMCSFVAKKVVERKEKYERVRQLMLIMEEIRAEEKERKANKKRRKEKKRKSSTKEKKRRGDD